MDDLTSGEVFGKSGSVQGLELMIESLEQSKSPGRCRGLCCLAFLTAVTEFKFV